MHNSVRLWQVSCSADRQSSSPLIWASWHGVRPAGAETEFGTVKTRAINIEKEQIVRNKLAQAAKSPLRTYKELTVGDASWSHLAYYELVNMLFGSLPGAAGFLLRKKAFPRLLRELGSGAILGRNIVIRHGRAISVGTNVTVDDNCLIDGRGAGEAGIRLGDGVIINRNCMLQAKSGPITIGARTTIGSNSVVVSLGGIHMGEAVLIAGGVYISAGAYRIDDADKAIMDQAAYTHGPISIGDHAWIGTGAILLDGIRVGRGAVIGAGAVVTSDVPERTVVAGVPARVLRKLD
jgi:acetyltransferase-like isoleucine patch superfamily enzyme